MPQPLRRGALGAIATVAWLCSPAKRRNVARNAAVAGRPLDRAGVRGVFRRHVENIAGMFSGRRQAGGNGPAIGIEGRELLDEALRSGGAVLATLHVGDWERAARHLACLGYPLHVVAGVQMNKLLTGALRLDKERRRIEVIGPADPPRRLYRALEEGGVLALLLDGDVFRGGESTSFLGRTVMLPGGAGRLAAATGRPILIGWSRRRPNGELSIRIERLESGGDGREINRRLYERLGEIVRSNIDQWCIFRDFFGEDGCGSESSRNPIIPGPAG